MAVLTERAAEWALAFHYRDMPPDVVRSTKDRLLDMIGASLAAGTTPFGCGMRKAAGALAAGAVGQARCLGTGERLPPHLGAMVNGSLAQALNFDDTHNETFVHPTSANAAAALALCEEMGLNGRALLAAMAVGIEMTCRIAAIAPGRFHGLGIHATAIFGTLGATYVAARLMGLSLKETRFALGHAGSFGYGLNECWNDGTDTHFVHAGWAAHSAISAAHIGRAPISGPAALIEGRYGIFAPLGRETGECLDFERMVRGLGQIWESRHISFKPYPSVHIMHGFLDALLHLRAAEGLRWDRVERITVRVPAYLAEICCEPREERVRPASASHARVSLPFSLAEALYTGRLAGDAYGPEVLTNPNVQALAGKVVYEIDPDAPGPERYQGWVIVDTRDGRRLEYVQKHNWGSAENPMTRDDITEKFMDNAGRSLPKRRCKAIVEAVRHVDRMQSVAELMDLCVA